MHAGYGTVILCRFNPYDRAPLSTLYGDDINKFYASYRALSSLIHDKRNMIQMKLKPGDVLLVDNWRVLHGRTSFSGRRVMCGAYLPRDDWISLARVLGLL